VTQPDDWEAIFKAAQQVPGGKHQQPGKKTYEEIARETEFARKRYTADVAVGLGAVDTGDDFDPWGWLSNWSGGIADQLTENTEAIANLADIAAATNTTPAYVSDIDAMASVPRFAVSTVTIVNSTTKPRFKDIDEIDSTVGYLHHGVVPVVKPIAPKGSSVGNIYYTPIVVDRRGTVEKLRWIAGAESSIFSIDYYEMALCIYNPATGNIEKVWGSGNIKDAEANIGAVGVEPDEVVITMMIGGVPLSQQCEPGQILFVAHQQTAPGLFQTARSIGAVSTPPIHRTVPLLDAWCYVAPSYSQGIPSSIAMTSLGRLNTCIPWMSVSVLAGS
jgi:hypothetical protein